MSHSPDYRRDIDGLRAIAILGVVLYHAFPWTAPGGFYGVDVFFVISGFLITGGLIKGFERGHFSLTGFYSRRIRRIFPALILVLLTFFALALLFLNALEVAQYSKHMAAASVFISNFTLRYELGYFDVNSLRKPLLHLWSLAIEEQFYLIWPLVVFVAWKTKISYLKTALICAALSLGLNIVETHQFTSRTFYLPQTRVWEILVGALLAALFAKRAREKSNASARVAHFLSGVGLILVLASFCIFNEASPALGVWALLPTLGTFLMILAGEHAFINQRFLGAAPLVFVGKISYPLYLWHWPLFAFARILEFGSPSSMIIAVATGIAFVAAWLTYVLVELRFRRLKNAPVVLLTLMVFVGLIGLWTWRKNGAITPRLKASARLIQTTQTNWIGKKFQMDCLKIGYPSKEGCLTDLRDSPHRLIIGDSHALALFPGLIDRSVQGERWAYLGTYGFKLAKGVRWKDDSWNRIQSNVLEYIQNSDAEWVVFMNASRAITDEVISTESLDGARLEALIEGFSDSVSLAENAGKKVVFVKPTPIIPGLPEDCIAPRPYRLSASTSLPCEISVSAHEEALSEWYALIDILQKRHPRLLIYDPNPLFCDGSVCRGQRDSRSLFGVTDHVSDYGAQLVADDLIGFLRESADRGPDGN